MNSTSYTNVQIVHIFYSKDKNVHFIEVSKGEKYIPVYVGL